VYLNAFGAAPNPFPPLHAITYPNHVQQELDVDECSQRLTHSHQKWQGKKRLWIYVSFREIHEPLCVIASASASLLDVVHLF
jgi:hypothetical protein